MNACFQAMRSLRRNPGSAAVATLILAFGIGGATSIFSAVNAVLLRPLPFRDPAKLAVLWTEIPRRDVHEMGVSYSSLTRWREQSRLISDMAIYESFYEALAWTEGLERIATADVSGSFFAVLGVAPIAGAVFSAADDRQGANLAVLSFGFWTSRFGGDPRAIGKTLEMTGKPYRIVAVMPDGFWFPDKAAQIWTLTAANHMQISGPVVARLKREATMQQAQDELSAVSSQLDPRAGIRVRMVPLLNQLAGSYTRRSMRILLAAAMVMLVIACSNVAHLMMARAVGREREFAIRAALGADRRRLISAMVAESLVLSGIAAVLGLVIAFAGIRLLPALAPPGLLRLDEADLSLKVVWFALGLSLAAWFLFGLAPVLRHSVIEPANALGPRRRSAIARRTGLLVVTQFAMAALLLTGAGLLLRSFLAIQKEDPGMPVDRLLSMRVYAMRLKRNDPRAPEFYRSVLARVESLPGVEAAGVISAVFKEEASGANRLSIEGGDGPPQEEVPQLTSDVVSAGFFRAAGVPLLAGRYFTDRDSPESPPAAIVNRALAVRFGPGSAVGRRFQFGPSGAGRPWLTVVGVVGNIRQLGLEKPPMPEVFMPLAQNPLSRMEIVVRAARPGPMQLATAVIGAVHAIDRTVVLYDVGPMEGRFAALIAQRRFLTGLLIAFSAIALALAGCGIYAAMHYSTVRQTRDIGIRMALGARPEDVLRMVLGTGLRLAALGLAIGLAGAQSMTFVLSSLLHGVAPTDLPTLSGVSALLITLALLAAWFPARRATKVDPLVALRSE